MSAKRAICPDCREQSVTAAGSETYGDVMQCLACGWHSFPDHGDAEALRRFWLEKGAPRE